MTLPTANKAVIDHWTQRANEKLSSFEERIERLERHITILRQEKHAAETTLAFFSLSESRKKLLLDLFVFPDEYGDIAELPEWYADLLRKHSERMSSSIEFYERCKLRRLDGIKFIRDDIERLKVIGNAAYQPSLFFQVLQNF